jgi:hypothetical protein
MLSLEGGVPEKEGEGKHRADHSQQSMSMAIYKSSMLPL